MFARSLGPWTSFFVSLLCSPMRSWYRTAFQQSTVAKRSSVASATAAARRRWGQISTLAARPTKYVMFVPSASTSASVIVDVKDPGAIITGRMRSVITKME